jgi:predicted RNA-binding Zn-ribbon protein involved in translation (DUF1610 family)
MASVGVPYVPADPVKIKVEPAQPWPDPHRMTIPDCFELGKRIVNEVMIAGVDYGVIQGTKGKRLFKPGAEKLCMGFWLTIEDPELLERVEDWTGAQHGGEPLFHYLVRQRLTRQGEVIASQCGSCNSREAKYRYRSADRLCPQCGQPAIRRSKYPPREDPRAKPGWYCYQKAGGCGANFAADAVDVSQPAARQLNPDVAEAANTILMMAQKRALIAATRLATATSSLFTDEGKEHDGPPQKETGDRSQESGASAAGAAKNGPFPAKAPLPTVTAPAAETPDQLRKRLTAELPRLVAFVGRTERQAARHINPQKDRLEELTVDELKKLYDVLTAPRVQMPDPAKSTSPKRPA